MSSDQTNREEQQREREEQPRQERLNPREPSDPITQSLTATPLPKGFFLMRPADRPVILPTYINQSPNWAGYTVRGEWHQVNPAPDKYDWTRLDDIIKRVTNVPGKLFKLTIFTGDESPPWLETKGVKFMTYVNRNPYRPPGSNKMPVPWDEGLLFWYGKFLQALARKYSSHTRLCLVHLGCVTRNSLEMHLPPECQYVEGYSREKIVQAWTTCIRNFKNAFPGMYGGLNLANPFNASDGIAAKVAEIHYNLLGKFAFMQSCALSAKDSFPKFNIYRILDSYKTKCRVGFEQVSSSDNQVRYQGTFEESLVVAKKAGAISIDVYEGDAKKVHTPWIP